MALEAIKRIDTVFDIERAINELAADKRPERRRQDSLPLLEELGNWMRIERTKLSRSSPVAAASDYVLKRWEAATRHS